MRYLFLLFGLFAGSVFADELALRPSARLLFNQPELLQAGRCVLYEEGGSGWLLPDPVYYIKGKVIAVEIQRRHIGRCPEVPGRTLEQYDRDEFNRHVLAQPCVSADVEERDEQIGIVRLNVTSWETPHARRMANTGRLYRGMLIDKPLKQGMEIELEADLLGPCDKP